MRARHVAVFLIGLTPAFPQTLEVLLHDGHFKRARAMAEAKPNDPEAVYAMSRLKQLAKDSKAAVELAEKAVAAAPQNPKYHLRLAEAVGEEARNASVLRQPGMAKRFKKEIETTLALDPKNVTALSHLMQYYFEAPGIMGGDKSKGQAIPDQILKIDPVEGYFALARLAQHEKTKPSPEELQQLYRKAVEARPNSYEARVALGGILTTPDSKYLAEAESNAREALRVDPTRIGAHGLLETLIRLQSKWAELDAVLAQAEKDVPDNLVLYFRAAQSCLSKGVELPRAERYFRKYLTQEPELGAPNHATAHWRLALAIEKQGRKPEAITELQTAVRMDPNSPAKQDLKRLK